MLDIRPLGYLIGWLVTALGASMVLPLLASVMAGHRNGFVFAEAGAVTFVIGFVTAVSCTQAKAPKMRLQDSFLMATGIWAVFPLFGALPFWLGAPNVSYTDAFFEAMSALTTTGATVFTNIELLPPGVLLWRGMLQWFGGLGIVVVAMVFLPALKVGGMQIFRSEAFDTIGKVLPRAGEIAFSLTGIYLFLTFLCFMGYVMTGMSSFDSVVHAMTTVSTGGMANSDASFSAYNGASHYVATAFMILSALPFVRYVQLMNGAPKPLFRDVQIRGFLLTILTFCLILTLVYDHEAGRRFEPMLREIIFNVTSIATGTGYTSADYQLWGPLAAVMFFIIGLIGGCSGSTACSVKIFRYQLLFGAISAEIKRLHSPNRVILPRYDGRTISDEVMNSVMAFFLFFFVTLSVAAILLVLVGLDPVTAISGAATAIANIGPGLGPIIGPAGNFATLPDTAKWILAIVMLLGRLELLSVFVLLTPAFWRG